MKLNEIKAMITNRHPLKGNSRAQEIKLYQTSNNNFYLNIKELSAQEYISANIASTNELILNRSIKAVVEEFKAADDFNDIMFFQLYYKSFEIPFMLGILNLNNCQLSLIFTYEEELLIKYVPMLPCEHNTVDLLLQGNTFIPKIYWDSLCVRVLDHWTQEEEHKEYKEQEEYLAREYVKALQIANKSLPHRQEIKFAKSTDNWTAIADHVQKQIDMGVYESIDELPEEYKHPMILKELILD